MSNAIKSECFVKLKQDGSFSRRRRVFFPVFARLAGCFVKPKQEGSFLHRRFFFVHLSASCCTVLSKAQESLSVCFRLVGDAIEVI